MREVVDVPRRTSGHVWRLARERSTRECEANVCQACALVRLTSYRTGQVVRYVTAEPMPAGTEHTSGGGELRSVARTTRFLVLPALRLRSARGPHRGRSTGISNLPPGDDWTKWDREQLRAAIDYLEQKRTGR